MRMPYEVWSDRDDSMNVQMMRDFRVAYEARPPGSAFRNT